MGGNMAPTAVLAVVLSIDAVATTGVSSSGLYIPESQIGEWAVTSNGESTVCRRGVPWQERSLTAAMVTVGRELVTRFGEF